MAELLHHFSHECPLTSPEIVTNGVCNSCYKDEAVDFSCDSCKFDLCKDCSKLPQIVSHDFHEHPLEFCLGEYDQKPDYIICSGCGNMSSGSFYKCKECEIYLDLGCALMENIFRGWESKELLSDSHCHLLRRSRPGPDVRGSCLLCELPLSPSSICYGCVHCYSFLHECCLNLPIEIQHPVHPSHAIRRIDYTRTFGGRKNCDACGEDIVNVPFGCLECKFNLHLRCADSLLRGLVHKSHEHKLFYVSSNAYQVFGEESVCQICMKTDALSLYSYYRCVECGLKFHFECLEIPESVVKKSCHVHPLVCKIFLSSEDDSLEYCGVCETMVYAGHHAYSCKECDFLGHIECILREEAPSPLYLKDLYSCSEEDIIRPKDQKNFETNNDLMVNGIEHVHMMRPVHLDEVDHESGNCDICAGKILGSPFKCEICSFQTHHFCAELGKPSRHRLHQNHPLTLLPKPFARDMMNCDSCKIDIDGFVLFCRVCDFIIHVSCALKGKTSLRMVGQKVTGTVRGRCVGDKHNMVQVIISSSYQTACTICDDRLYGKALACIECEEVYHHRCTELRKQLLRHPLHSSHSLEMSSAKGSKCIACTLYITNYGYRCSTCKVNFHVKCIDTASVSGKIGSHSHNLYHFHLDHETRTCSVCAKPCVVAFYSCIDCNFNAHGGCVGYPDNVKNQQHHHVVTLKYCHGKGFCHHCKVECGDDMIYACNHCSDTFLHRECTMSSIHHIYKTEEEQLEDIRCMRLELQRKSDENVRRVPPKNQYGMSQAHLDYILYG